MQKLFSESFGQGPDLVLLHGWGMHSGVWQRVALKLSETFRVTLIDLPGFGRSPVLSDDSVSSIIKHILEVAPLKATWIGWSLGGLIATKIASNFPERVTKLICVASSPKFLQEANWPGLAADVLEKFANQLHHDYEGTLNRFLLLQFHGLVVEKDMMQWLQSNLFKYGKPTLHTLTTGLLMLNTLDCRNEIKNIACPIEYILGRLDTLVPAKIVEDLPALSSNI
jgi:pimeloyl-[acyl-carrier protein] methyl ester esterase